MRLRRYIVTFLANATQADVTEFMSTVATRCSKEDRTTLASEPSHIYANFSVGKRCVTVLPRLFLLLSVAAVRWWWCRGGGGRWQWSWAGGPWVPGVSTLCRLLSKRSLAFLAFERTLLNPLPPHVRIHAHAHTHTHAAGYCSGALLPCSRRTLWRRSVGVGTMQHAATPQRHCHHTAAGEGACQ